MFQFAVLMWLLTYVGALFNGLTLLILGEVIPKSRSASNFQALLLTHTHSLVLRGLDGHSYITELSFNEKNTTSLSLRQNQINLLDMLTSVERVQYLFTFPVYIR